jgi:hypothetical protein
MSSTLDARGGGAGGLSRQQRALLDADGPLDSRLDSSSSRSVSRRVRSSDLRRSFDRDRLNESGSSLSDQLQSDQDSGDLRGGETAGTGPGQRTGSSGGLSNRLSGVETLRSVASGETQSPGENTAQTEAGSRPAEMSDEVATQQTDEPSLDDIAVTESGELVSQNQPQPGRVSLALRKEIGTVDGPIDAAKLFSAQLGTNISAGEVVERDGTYQIREGVSDQIRRRQAAEQFSDQLGTEVSPWDVIEQGGEYRLDESRLQATDRFSDQASPGVAGSQVRDERRAVSAADGPLDAEERAARRDRRERKIAAMNNLEPEDVTLAPNPQPDAVLRTNPDAQTAQVFLSDEAQQTLAKRRLENQPPNITDFIVNKVQGAAETISPSSGLAAAGGLVPDAVAAPTADFADSTLDLGGDALSGAADAPVITQTLSGTRTVGDELGDRSQSASNDFKSYVDSLDPSPGRSVVLNTLGREATKAAGGSIISLPATIAGVAAGTENAFQTVQENVREEGIGGGLSESGEQAAAVGGTAALGLGLAFSERPVETTGQILGGALASYGTGIGGARAIRSGLRTRPVTAVRDRIRTAGGEFVPLEELTTPAVAERFTTDDTDIADAEEKFPGATRQDLVERDDPAEAVRQQSAEQVPDVLAARFDEIGISGTGLFKTLDVTPEGPERGRSAQGFSAPEADSDLADEYETSGQSFGPSVSPNFLRIGDPPDGSAGLSLRPGLPSLRPSGVSPTTIFTRTDVENPDARTIQQFDAELRDRAGDPTALAVRREFEDMRPTEEIEAQTPPGSEFVDVGTGPLRNLARRLGIGADFYTRVQGRRVPLRTVAPESELPSSTFVERLRTLAADERGELGAGGDVAPARVTRQITDWEPDPPTDRPLPLPPTSTPSPGEESSVVSADASLTDTSGEGPVSTLSYGTPSGLSTSTLASSLSSSPSRSNIQARNADGTSPSGTESRATPSESDGYSSPGGSGGSDGYSSPGGSGGSDGYGGYGTDTPGNPPPPPPPPRTPGTPPPPQGSRRRDDDDDEQFEEEFVGVATDEYDRDWDNPIERLGDPGSGPDTASPADVDMEGPEWL